MFTIVCLLKKYYNNSYIPDLVYRVRGGQLKCVDLVSASDISLLEHSIEQIDLKPKEIRKIRSQVTPRCQNTATHCVIILSITHIYFGTIRYLYGSWNHICIGRYLTMIYAVKNIAINLAKCQHVISQDVKDISGCLLDVFKMYDELQYLENNWLTIL
ncbi:hypothetical protein ACJX0J_006425, partial [Zea mays]